MEKLQGIDLECSWRLLDASVPCLDDVNRPVDKLTNNSKRHQYVKIKCFTVKGMKIYMFHFTVNDVSCKYVDVLYIYLHSM